MENLRAVSIPETECWCDDCREVRLETLDQILNKEVPGRADAIFEFIHSVGGKDKNSAVSIYACACVLANLLVDGTTDPAAAWKDVQTYAENTMTLRRRAEIGAVQ